MVLAFCLAMQPGSGRGDGAHSAEDPGAGGEIGGGGGTGCDRKEWNEEKILTG